MEKKFRVLRIIGTFWKVLAWITLVIGVLSSLGILLAGVLGSGGFILRLFEQRAGAAIPGAFGLVGSVLGFIVALVFTLIYFLVLYAVGDLIYLLLAIEENTRRTTYAIQRNVGAEPQSPTAPPATSA